MANISAGQRVNWNWGNGSAEGTIREIFTSKTTVTIKGTDVTRNTSEDEPAFLIEQDDGDKVLKSSSELHA